MIIVFVSKCVCPLHSSIDEMSENDVRRWSAFSLTPRNVLFGCNTDFKWTVSLQVMWFFSSASGRTQRKHTTLMLTLTMSLKHEQGHSSPPDTSAGTRPWSGFTLCRLSCFIKVFHVWPHGGSERTKESVWTVKTSGMNSGVIINSTVCSRLCLELTAAFISESTCPVDLNAPEALLPEHLQLRLADKSMKKQRWVSRGV